MSELHEFIKNNSRDFTAPNNLINEKQLDSPFKLFEFWMNAAVKKKIATANCMQISTVSEFGYPSSRIVFLREYNEKGFIFYTNYHSRKGKDIAANNRISALFFWVEMECQIRIEGEAEKVEESVSDTYFANRPRESQLSAWASNQSQPIENREELIEKMEYFDKKFKDIDVPRPNHWGGYILLPEHFEFWMARHGRLHDRLIYSKSEGEKGWSLKRIAP